MTDPEVRVLFVCWGNICRSPTVHGVFRAQVRERGLEGRVASDSAGTLDYHVGKPPDPRAQAAALRRGIDLSDLRARLVTTDDFERFDYVLAMDHENRAELLEMAPDPLHERIRLFLDFAEDVAEGLAPDLGGRVVPDPYQGGPEDFELVLDLADAGACGLLDEIERTRL